MVLLRAVPHALERIDTAAPLLDLAVVVAQELKTLRGLVAKARR
jgi:hypothetical protein